MKEEIESLLTVCEVSLIDNKSEKEKLLEILIYFNRLLTVVFSSNKNLEKALQHFNEIISSYIEECEAEYLFFEKAIKYLEGLLNDMDAIEEDVLSDINDAIDYIEDLFTTRTISTAQVYAHFKDIIDSRILTNSNFYIANFSDRFDEEEKNRLLSCIPDV